MYPEAIGKLRARLADRQKTNSALGETLMNAVRAALCCALFLLGPTAQAADKVIAGSLGGQAPLWAIYVAVHKGFFAAEGLDVELNFAQSGAAVTQQLTGGSLDVALSVGITDPIRAIDKGAPLALIRVIGNAPPYVLIGKPGLKSIADLKGKIISVGADNDITTVYFERMMAANGFKKGDYDTIPAGVAAARFAALKAGVVDAAIVLPPLNFQATAQGFVTLGLAADYVKDIPFTGMAVHRRWAAANLRPPNAFWWRPTRASPGSPTRRIAAKPSSFWSRLPVRAKRMPRRATTISAASTISSPAARCRARNCAI